MSDLVLVIFFPTAVLGFETKLAGVNPTRSRV